jgi:hypothetical protein
MKNLLSLLLCPLVVTIFSSNVLGQELTATNNTGDAEMDSYLSEINDKAASDYDSFREELSESSEITAEEIDRYVKEENMEPADVYYASVLSSATDKPVSEVVELYSEKKGWGAVAKELGIKPGSEAFHELKANTIKETGKDKQKKNKVERTKKRSKNRN